MSALLEVDTIVAGYRPGLPILHGVSLHVAAGEFVTLIDRYVERNYGARVAGP